MSIAALEVLESQVAAQPTHNSKTIREIMPAAKALDSFIVCPTHGS